MNMSTDVIPKWRRSTGWVRPGVLAVPFLPCACFKIAQPQGFLEEEIKTYPRVQPCRSG